MKTALVVGTGVIGCGWISRFLANGIDVLACDQDKNRESIMHRSVQKGLDAMASLTMVPPKATGNLTFVSDLESAARKVDFIQECIPEREELKKSVLKQIATVAEREILIASSSSGLLPTRLQADCCAPDRILIGHPFNPVYLLPLVEVVGGQLTSKECISTAIEFYRSIGMYPLHVRHEVEGFISDRLQEAMWREALHLINDGVAEVTEIDDAITYGPGLRWAIMGICQTFHLAGGDKGMRHMLAQFGPALALPWTRLKAPDLTAQLIEKLVDGTEQQADGESISELEEVRDQALIGIMRTLTPYKLASGKVISDFEERQRLSEHQIGKYNGSEIAAPLSLHHDQVHPIWVDYNGHMSESYYLLIFGDASDALFRYLGIDQEYRDAGNSFYTVETHMHNFREISCNEPLYVTTQLLAFDSKRLQIFHKMHHGRNHAVLATAEQMLLHVDMNAGKVAPIPEEVTMILAQIMKVHSELPIPNEAGKSITMPER